MKRKPYLIYQRLFFYVLGLFLLTLGVSFSIIADFGVSPVSSLAYALTLATGVSVGVMTIATNVLFIVVQIWLNKKVQIKQFFMQLLVSFLFGFFMDFTLWLVKNVLPEAMSVVMQIVYLCVSLCVIGLALIFYLNAKLPLMPYDALTYAIADRFKLEFSKAKIISDILNVIVALLLSILTIHSFGSIGIGTIFAAYMIGKIISIYMRWFGHKFVAWLYKTNAI